MYLCFFMFSLIFSGTYNYVESAYSDLLMKNGECEKAYLGYLNDYEKTKNPLLASNLALSLLCMKKYKDALKYIEVSYEKMPTDTPSDKAQEIKFNYAYILSFVYEFSKSNTILATLDIDKLKSKANYYFIKCRNEMYLNKKSLDYCLKARAINTSDCSISNLLALNYYYLENYDKALLIYKSTFELCKTDDSVYYYSLSLYKSGQKDISKLILSNNFNSSRNKELYDILSKE